jgi:glycosyltransferase involved in cell wall biosynthesis/predicted O-methyltransferase YrrM
VKVCFQASDFDGPGAYRCGFPAMELRRRGHECVTPSYVTVPGPGGKTMSIYDLKTVPPTPDADVYVAQMRKEVVAKDANAQLTQWFGKVVVAECDDDYLNVPKYNAAYKGALAVRQHLFDGFANATAMTVSTPALKDVYSQFHSDITVLRNYLDWPMWKDVEQQSEVERPGGRVRVGWMGRLGWRKGDVLVLRDVVKKLLARNPHVDFVSAGSEDERVHDLLMVPRDRRVTYPPIGFNSGRLTEITAVMDVGLVPLVKNRFNEGKSHLKGMEYNACGIPFVASPTESYAEYYCEEGVNGLLAGSANEWLEHLELLVNDDELRRNMGRDAREHAAKHTIQEHGGQWETLYQRLLGENPQSDLQLARLCVARGALQKPKEFEGLVAMVRNLQPQVVVEIGSAKGGSLYGWCQLAAPDATIISIDLPGGEFGGGMDEMHALLVGTYAKERQSMHFLPRDSHAPETLEALETILAGRKIDLLHIDGDHTYEGVKSDYEMYAPLVRSGGLIAFHDVLPHPGFPSCKVDELWDQLKHADGVSEFFDYEQQASWGQWGGIGVIVREDEALPVAA